MSIVQAEPCRARYAQASSPPNPRRRVTVGTREEEDGLAFLDVRRATSRCANISALWPELQKRGVPSITISPQVPERLAEIRDRHALGFTIASDPDNRLARAIAIAFAASAEARLRPVDHSYSADGAPSLS